MTKPISDVEVQTSNYVAPNNATLEIPVGEIRASALNPRKHFDEASLEKLINSVRLLGVEQAITVRPTGEGATPFEIVMGERRWRAATAAGLATIPACIKPCTDEELVSRALVENLVREDLSCIELALAYRALADQKWTQERIAEHVGTDQPTVSLVMNLLRLPEYVQGILQTNNPKFTRSHGAALLSLAEDEKACNWLAKCALDEGLTEKDLREKVRSKRQEIDDKKKQPALPLEGVTKTTKTTETTTTTPAAPPKPASEVNEKYTRDDAKKEFAESQKPDPLVPPLSSLPTPPAEATGAAAPVPVTPTKANDEPLKQSGAPKASTGKTVGVHIDQRWDDWLWENNLDTVDAALEQLATLRQRPQLSAMAHKCLKAICPEGVELSTFLEDVLVGRARTEGIDINTLNDIPE